MKNVTAEGCQPANEIFIYSDWEGNANVMGCSAQGYVASINLNDQDVVSVDFRRWCWITGEYSNITRDLRVVNYRQRDLLGWRTDITYNQD